MHLIAPLVSGIANAGDGSARITRRGSTTLATLYSSFEGDSFSSAMLDDSDNVELDAYGRAEVYVDELVDVTVYDSDGVQQIAFTAGISAGAIEVRSNSFSGSSYDGSASSDQPGQPTTLQEILDLWRTTRGSPDWGLTSSTLPFITVTDDSYGAVGDGVNDDTTAIQAAINAASGGIVFFPPGTYRTTSELSIGTAGAILVGTNNSTQATCILSVDGAGVSLFSTQTITKHLVLRGLKLTGAQDKTAALIDLSASVVNTAFDMHECYATATFTSGHLIQGGAAAIMRMSWSTLVASGTAASCIHDTVSLNAANCTFSGGTGAYTGDGHLYGHSFFLVRCSFSSSHTSGTLANVKYDSGSGTMFGSITGCSFTATDTGTGTTVGMDLDHPDTASSFIESGNVFPVRVPTSSRPFTAYAYGTDSRNIHLRTRDTRSVIITDNSATVELPTDQYGLVILSTTNAAVSFEGNRPPHGATGIVLVYHPSGGAGTATPTTNFFGGTAATTANTSTHAWHYVCTAVNVTNRMFIVVDGKACGNGA